MTRGTGNEGNVGAPRPEPAAGGSASCTSALRVLPAESGADAQGDMRDPHICEKNVGRQPDEAAFWKGSARGNLFLLKEVPSRPFSRHLHSSSNSFS